MPVKHFIINPRKNELTKEEINSIRESEERLLLQGDKKRFLANKVLIGEDDELKCVEGRVIVKVDLTNKNFHTFENGLTIRRERKYNNFNLRETDPVNCIVIDSSYIPADSEILVHPTSIHDSNRIFNYKENNSDVKYYSVNEEMCYAYFDDEWKPLKGFDFALRVFRPYTGFIQGIEPEIINDCLYVTTGELKGKVVMTLKACDYEIVFQNINGREGNIIRFRPFGDGKDREPEAIAIYEEYTEMVENGKLYVGLTTSNCKPLNEFVPND